MRHNQGDWKGILATKLAAEFVTWLKTALEKPVGKKASTCYRY
jgi:hypothetical protein